MKVEYVRHYGDDLLVANCARVSFNKWKNTFSYGDEKGSDERLIKYLAKENHITPFCHPVITMRITAPIFIARQCAKHQIGFVWSEVSRRYVDSEPEFFFPDSWRKKSEIKKQGSGEDLPKNIQFCCDSLLHEIHFQTKNTYNQLLDLGVAPEQARMVLPSSFQTTWIWTGSLAAWARVYKLRTGEDAQKEWKILTDQYDKIISDLFPVSWSALKGI